MFLALPKVLFFHSELVASFFRRFDPRPSGFPMGSDQWAVKQLLTEPFLHYIFHVVHQTM